MSTTTHQPQRPTGLAYFSCQSGILNIIEEILNLVIFIYVLAAGCTTRSIPLVVVTLVSFITTLALIILHIKGVIRRSKLPCHWIEFFMVFIIGVFIVIGATAAFSEFTVGYIVVGIVGYILAMVYFVDTFDKYQVAVTPAVRYAWTTPNMPDLN